MPKRSLLALPTAAVTLCAIGCSTSPVRNERWSEARPLDATPREPRPLDPNVWRIVDDAATALPQAAAKPATYADGFSLAVYGVRHAMGGDFDGSTALVGPLDLIVLPDYDAGLGLGASIGIKSSGGSLDMYLEATEHDGDFGGLDIGGKLVNFGFRGRFVPGRFDSPSQRWQPYFLVGLAFNLLTIEDGSTDGVQVGDGELTGFSLEAGGGGLVNLAEHLALRLDVGYRWTRFDSAEGVAGSGTLDDSVAADGLFLALGAVFTF